ncbi:hypothetical protein IA69_09275 [Massilia sp. JS1662]|nr:hypothetical protein IA69_09275 [Massilia sp. JS1662]
MAAILATAADTAAGSHDRTPHDTLGHDVDRPSMAAAAAAGTVGPVGAWFMGSFRSLLGEKGWHARQAAGIDTAAFLELQNATVQIQVLPGGGDRAADDDFVGKNERGPRLLYF